MVVANFDVAALSCCFMLSDFENSAAMHCCYMLAVANFEVHFIGLHMLQIW